MPVHPAWALVSDIGELGLVGGEEDIAVTRRETLCPPLRAPYTARHFAQYSLFGRLVVWGVV
jgi:hypothetical protein